MTNATRKIVLYQARVYRKGAAGVRGEFRSWEFDSLEDAVEKCKKHRAKWEVLETIEDVDVDEADGPIVSVVATNF